MQVIYSVQILRKCQSGDFSDILWTEVVWMLKQLSKVNVDGLMWCQINFVKVHTKYS